MSNNDVEGRLLEFSGREYMVRARGYLRSVADIEQISLGATKTGTPVRIRDVATVGLGPDLRRGIAELDGQGEVVGGIVIMRFGENALTARAELQLGLRQETSRPSPSLWLIPPRPPLHSSVNLAGLSQTLSPRLRQQHLRPAPVSLQRGQILEQA
jgi:Cu(I)/Ag(I) efflux system membrane protein CusA/SilA